jgi:transglutaminase-like putative cysteine protease
MLFHIKHASRFRYTRPVFCEPMTLRLRPREDASQRLLRHHVWVDPEPAGMTEYVDLDGHAAVQLWFDGLTSSLSVVVSSTVETLRINPFDFLLPADAVRLPFRYSSAVERGLSAYLGGDEPAPAVREAADAVLQRSKGQTIPFLTELTGWMQASFDKVVRLEGPPLPAVETLAARSGSCRDLAVLFNEICRSVGIAARFVSGYHERESPDGRRHLHAWSEVYLPGAGWRGFDPAEGLAVADRHVALAAGLQPVLAAPTDGTFRGNGASSTLDSQIVIRTGKREAAAGSAVTADSIAASNVTPIDAVA